MIWVLVPFKDRALYNDFLSRRSLCAGVSYLYIVNDKTRSDKIEVLNETEHVLMTKDSGMYDAWNQGIDLIVNKAKWIIFLGEDDELNPDYIKRLSDLEEGVHIAYGDIIKVKRSGEKRVVYSDTPELFSNAQQLIQDVPHPGCAFAGELFSKYNLRYDTKYKLAGDLDLYLNIKKKVGEGLKYSHINIPQARIGGYGVSQTNRGYKRYKIEWDMIYRDYDVKVRVPFKARVKEIMFWLK